MGSICWWLGWNALSPTMCPVAVSPSAYSSGTSKSSCLTALMSVKLSLLRQCTACIHFATHCTPRAPGCQLAVGSHASQAPASIPMQGACAQADSLRLCTTACISASTTGQCQIHILSRSCPSFGSAPECNRRHDTHQRCNMMTNSNTQKHSISLSWHV